MFVVGAVVVFSNIGVIVTFQLGLTGMPDPKITLENC